MYGRGRFGCKTREMDPKCNIFTCGSDVQTLYLVFPWIHGDLFGECRFCSGASFVTFFLEKHGLLNSKVISVWSVQILHWCRFCCGAKFVFVLPGILGDPGLEGADSAAVQISQGNRGLGCRTCTLGRLLGRVRCLRCSFRTAEAAKSAPAPEKKNKTK